MARSRLERRIRTGAKPRLALGVALGVLLVLLAVVAAVPRTGPLLGGSRAATVPAAAPGPTGAGHRASSVPSLAPAPAARASAGPSLTVVGSSPAAIALSWTATNSIGFSNYSIAESSVGATGPWAVVCVVTSQTTTNWSAGSITPGATEWWQVTSNALLGTAASNVAANTQPMLAYLTYTLPSGSSAKFAWTNNATYGGLLGFTSYGLYEQVGGGAPSFVASIPTISTHNYTVTGLAGGQGYTFYLNTNDCYASCGTGSAALSITSSNAVTFGAPVPLAASVSDVRSVIDTGQSDLFTCNPAGGQAPYSFAWDLGNGTFSAGASSVSTSYPTPGTPSVTCRITDHARTIVSAAIRVAVNPAPTVAVAANGTARDVGEPLALNCSVENGTPSFSFAWRLGDGGSATGPAAGHTYRTPGTDVVVCEVTDATTTTVASALPITVSPRLSVAATADTSAAAPGTTINWTAVATNGSGTVSSYNWTFGDGGHANGVSASHAYSAPGTYAAFVLATDSNGAGNRSVASVVVSPITIRLGAAPTAGRTGELLAFIASASGGAGGPYNYTWSFGDGTTGFGANVTHRYATAGSFSPTVRVVDRLGATNSSTTPALAVTVPPPPPPLVPLWALVLLLVVIVAIVAALGYRELRRRRSAALRAAAPWAPPTDPSRTMFGRKNCPTCGHSNVPLRETCENCGASLPRRSQHS